MATRTTFSMPTSNNAHSKQQFQIVGAIEDLTSTLDGSPASAPSPTSASNSQDRPRKPTHQRVQAIRLASIARPGRRTGTVGTTSPFQPSAPSLLRVAASEGETVEVLTQKHDPSPLRQVALSSPVKPRRSMPHAVSMPQSGFQALILCGPGIGLSTFTSVPQEYPKALVEVANRPMVWYVLDWCYRMGVTDITLITPPESKDALAAALAQNPHLTSLPSPSPDLLCPAELEYETATAELLRLPEVQKAINSDFVLLPCDLICTIPGETLLDTYISSIGGLGGVGITASEYEPSRPTVAGIGGESSGRRGGLSIWYNTANREESVKKEECDFMCSTKLAAVNTSPLPNKADSTGTLRQLVWTMPMSEVKEQTAEDKPLRVRSSLLRRYGNVKALTQYRDAHIYFLPYWTKEFAAQNDDFESVSEDLIGTWAKAEWRKPSYRARFHTSKIFSKPTTLDAERLERPIEDEIDLLSFSSTQTPVRVPTSPTKHKQPLKLASRVQANPEDSILSDPSTTPDDGSSSLEDPSVPPIAAYILPSASTAPLIRRIDTTPLLLSINLLLAKTSSVDDDAKSYSQSSPLAHSSKISATATIAPQVTISKSDCLVGDNTTISTRCVIKNSVIGANVTIGSRTRIIGSVVMDGAVVGEGVELTGTVVGKRAKVGDKGKLTGCEVQDGNVLPEGTEGKGESFLVGGLEDEDEDFDDEGDEAGNEGEEISLA